MSAVFFMIGFAFCLTIMTAKYVEALVIACLVVILAVIDYGRG